MLSPWVGWFARLVRSCKLAQPRWQFGLLSNPSICERMISEVPAADVATFAAVQSDLLRAFEFDRSAYARDLFRYGHDPPRNGALIRRLTEVKQAFHPDLVLSFSQNRYVRPVLQTPVLFLELGPLPRSVTRPHFFLDPLGHQTESLLVTEIRAITSRPLAAQRQREVQRFWFETCEQPITATSSTADLQAFLHESRRGRKVVLLALRVYPSVSGPCAAQGHHADPALWPPRQSPSYLAPGRLPGRPRCPHPLHLTKQKPWKSSSFECSGPTQTAARTVAKDGSPRSEPSRLSRGPPAHRCSDGRPKSLRLPAPATSSDPAAGRLAPTSPIDPFPPLDHTSS